MRATDAVETAIRDRARSILLAARRSIRYAMAMRRARSRLWLVLCVAVSCDGAGAGNSESQVEVVLHNGDVAFEGLLTLPEGEGPFPVVMFMTGSGPSPHRFYYSATENFHDPIAELFNAADLGYFSFDKRGSSDSQAEPYYVIDEPVYLTSTLTNMTADGKSRSTGCASSRAWTRSGSSCGARAWAPRPLRSSPIAIPRKCAA